MPEKRQGPFVLILKNDKIAKLGIEMSDFDKGVREVKNQLDRITYMTITFIGHGYVGLVTAAVFADLGNTVWVIGHTKEKIDNLNRGIIPIYEPGLEELVKKNVKAKRLIFTLDYQLAIPESDVVFIAVGTPPQKPAMPIFPRF